MAVRPLAPADFARAARQRGGKLRVFLGGDLGINPWRDQVLGGQVHSELDADGEPFWPEAGIAVTIDGVRYTALCTGPYPIPCEDGCYCAPGAEGHGLGVDEDLLCGVAECCESLDTEGKRRAFLVNSTVQAIRKADVLFAWFTGTDQDRSSLVHVGIAKGLGTKLIIVAAADTQDVPHQVAQLAERTVIGPSQIEALGAAIRFCNDMATEAQMPQVRPAGY